MGKKNIGSSFDDFLAEEAILEESTAVAMKRVIAWQIAQEMKAQQMTKTDLAKRMHTSRAALNRLLDENDGSLTLTTLASAAAALGKRVLVAFLHFRLRLLKGPWIETTTLIKPLEHRIQIANDLQLRTLPLRNGEIGLPLPLKQSGTTV